MWIKRLGFILSLFCWLSQLAYSAPISIPEDQYLSWMQQLSNIELQLNASQESLKKAGKLNASLRQESERLTNELRLLRVKLSESKNSVEELGEQLSQAQKDLTKLQQEFDGYKKRCEAILMGRKIEKWLFAGGGLLIGFGVGYLF